MSVATSQVPGVYRRRIGDILVTALSDGHIVLPPEVFQGITPEEIEQVMRAGGRRPPFTTSINAYLLQWSGHTVLVDAGTGNLMGPAAGKLAPNLAAAGVAVEDVSAVLMTHLHIDHAGGLVNDAGEAVYPNAEIVVSETEIAFWQDDAAMAATPEALRSAFDVARKTTAPYANRTRRFTSGEVLPGIEVVALPGHTPGHTGYHITSGGESLLIWGDVVHRPVLQAARPDVTLAFDNNPPKAAETRRNILAKAADEDLLVTGMHMSFPGFARIARSGEAYAVQPDVWAELS